MIKLFAVIKTGGKQYKVQSGDMLKLEKLAAHAETKYSLMKLCCSAEIKRWWERLLLMVLLCRRMLLIK